ncbi:MAG TPA: A24 family peptidase [Gemmataceae bacterium]|nr:A24 family peptidase [Gemmataceae bacterium]
MPQPFFPPAAGLAWAFYAALVGILAAATWTDLRGLLIPKWITLPALGLGLVLNVALGAWLGADGEGHRGFCLGGLNSWWLGALDRLLFSLAGFAAAFGLFLVMYLLGTCKGGDLKLFAAVGAWVGPVLVIWLLAGTIVFVVVFAVLRLGWSMIAGRGFSRTVRDYSLKGAARGGKKQPDDRVTRRRLMAYSPAVLLSTALVLLWVFRVDLHLAQPKPQPQKQVAARR